MTILSRYERRNEKICVVVDIPDLDGETKPHMCYVFKTRDGLEKPVHITSLLKRDWENFSHDEKVFYANMVFDNIMPFVIVRNDSFISIEHNIDSDPFFNSRKSSKPFEKFINL